MFPLMLLVLLVAAGSSVQAQDPAWAELPWSERIGVGWYKELAERGDPESQYRLALLLERAEEEELRETAREWYEVAAKQGHVSAQFSLARLLYPEDPATAVRWYRAAAESGSGGAAFNLAVILENGQGIAAELDDAARLYELAFTAGVEQAALNRGLLEYKRPEPDWVTATMWALRAEQAGVPEAGEAVAALSEKLTAAERLQARKGVISDIP